MGFTAPLNQGISTVVNAAGRAEVFLAPSGPGESWFVNLVAVSVDPFPTGTDPIPIATMYLDSQVAVNSFGATETGYNDMYDCSILLAHNQRLWIVWENAVVGATATMSIFGERRVE